jgi:UDP:flavonoid glycosyltransferase YjiC (YdhE family)
VSILEQARVLVTHAGNNSVTEAAAHGVPMLMLPFSTDQFDGAAAIEAAGFGVAADPNRATPIELADAVRCLVSTTHPALDCVAGEIALHPGAAIARAAVARWLGRAPTATTHRGAAESGSKPAGPTPATGRSPIA